MRPHIKSVPDEFEAFARDLEERKDDVTLIAEARNGFEGWLKVEFYRWLRERHNLGTDDIGMEYRLNRGAEGHYEKRCDLWVRALGNDRYHYVELKVPFANTNKWKMLRFGGDDLWHMMNIAAEREGAASGSAILWAWASARTTGRTGGGWSAKPPVSTRANCRNGTTSSAVCSTGMYGRATTRSGRRSGTSAALAEASISRYQGPLTSIRGCGAE